MLTQAVNGRCTVAQVSNWMSRQWQRRMIVGRTIAPGYDADLVLVDLNDTYHPVLRENSDEMWLESV
jgi:dihydroorotase